MKKIYYYYDPVVMKLDNETDRYFVDYYQTDGKHNIWSGRIIEDSPLDALRNVRKLLTDLNKQKPFFGADGRLKQWFRWRRDIRNQKKLKDRLFYGY